MTVAELIKELQKFKSNELVAVNGEYKISVEDFLGEPQIVGGE